MTPPIDLCWSTLRHLRLLPLLRAAATGGFDGVTATPAMVRQALAGGGQAELHDHITAAGVIVAGLDPLVAPLPGTPQTSSDEIANSLLNTGTTEAFDLASASGAEVVNLVHFLGDPDTPRAALIEAVGAVCAQAQTYGLRLTLEFLPESAVPDLATALAIVRGVGAPNLGVQLDTFHFCRSGGLAEHLAAAGGAITGIQVADRGPVVPGSRYVPMSDRLLPGAGELPLVAVTAATLRASGDQTRLGLEAPSALLRGLDPDDAALRSGHALRRLLEEIARSNFALGSPDQY